MILDDIGTALTNAGIVGGVSGWTLAKGFFPPTPDKVIGIFETGSSQAPETTTNYEFPTIQIRVRGEKYGYEVTRTKINAVMNAIHSQDITNMVYLYANSSAFLMGYDGNNRPELVLNFNGLRLRT
jgi:hypothetical protein